MNATVSESAHIDTGSLRVQVVDGYDELREHEQAWNALASTSVPARPMYTAAWVLSFLENCVPREAPVRCAFAWAGTRLVGALPLVRLGTTGQSTTDMKHTLSGGPLLEAASSNDVCAALIDAQLRDRPRPALIKLGGVVRDGPLDQALGSRTLRRPSGVEGARLATGEPFEALQARLGAKTRSRLRAAVRKLEALGSLTHERWANDDALARFDDFLQIEGSGWKGRAGTDIASDELAFYRSLTQRMAELGWLQIDLLRVDQRAIAGQLVVNFFGTQFVQKIAYDENLAKHSPGHVLWERYVRACCDDESVNAVDTIGTDHIRRRWRCEPYWYDDLYLFARGLRGHIARSRTALRAAVGRFRHRLRDRQSD